MDQEASSEKETGQSQEAAAAAPGAEQAEKPHPEFEIDIFRDWCKGCGICAAFCPRQCIVMDEEGQPVIDKPERCTGCRWCELHCPDFAICVKELVAKEVKPEEAD
jgi:2-oxoglutarate ferredoxin oxidoreductase subunit delta